MAMDIDGNFKELKRLEVIRYDGFTGKLFWVCGK